MKRAVAFLLAVWMMFSCVPFSVFAEKRTNEKESIIAIPEKNKDLATELSDYMKVKEFNNNWKYLYVNGDHIQLVEYLGDSTEVVIPSQGYYSLYEGYAQTSPIKYIRRGCFKNRSDITSVSIPYPIEGIWDSAFWGCTGLEKVETGSLEWWCKIEFTDKESNPLYYAHTLYVGGSPVDSITIPETIEVVKANSFCGFSDLKSVVFPENVITIEANAFSECTGLTSLSIPKSVTNIHSTAFMGCSNIETIEVAEDNPKYCSKGNCLIDKETGTVVFGCKNSMIPDDGTVKSIGNWAFANCGVDRVFIPDGVEYVGGQAFCVNTLTFTYPHREFFDFEGMQGERIVGKLRAKDEWENVCDQFGYRYETSEALIELSDVTTESSALIRALKKAVADAKE